MWQYILRFDEIDRTKIGEVGGKGANLGEMFRVPGIQVPDGFCITTKAYTDFVAGAAEFQYMINALEQVDEDNLEKVAAMGRQMRQYLETVSIPEPIVAEIEEVLAGAETDFCYAVRSSATAEDLPGASFAGQQETFLNVKGRQELLDCVRKCWASLFTDRAIVYRKKNGFEHNKVFLSVVVQRMIEPEVAGILFTADPVSGNRKVVSIDASFGLGEALVSGLVTADLYKVKDDRLIEKKIARKQVAIYSADIGTVTKEIADGKQVLPSLSDDQAIQLAQVGKRLERHFGSPQDIEWGIMDNVIYILQSRPITTLFPVPDVTDDELHLFLSMGHPQMMTDPMKPLGLSVLRTVAPFGKQRPQDESVFLVEAGNRPYIDATALLGNKWGRRVLPAILANVDEAMSRAVQEYIRRMPPGNGRKTRSSIGFGFIRKALPIFKDIVRNILYHDNHQVTEEMSAYIAGRVKSNQEELAKRSGADRIRYAQKILDSLLPDIFFRIAQYMGAGIITFKLIHALSRRWLGDARELGSIGKSPLGNVTSEMGLALGDLSDLAKQSPAIVEYMAAAADETFFAGLAAVQDSNLFRQRFSNFLTQYGMRGTGEIDITRPRWRETPSQLVPAIMSHIRGREPGAHRREFVQGRAEADEAAETLHARLRETPGGYFKALLMARLVKAHRNYIGLREHPKYFLVQNLDLIKQAVLEEAETLQAAGVIERNTDVFWLSLNEIAEALETGQVDHSLLTVRREAYERSSKLVPPRAMTSEGEIIKGKLATQNVPDGAIAGSGVSTGVVEGRACVIPKLEDAKMEKGDILVTTFTDPSWTPLFPLAAGLVTEVGGLMTHGAVVAREYGIPAVVGVDGAMQLIKDGQTIRINGDDGYIEIIS